MVSPNLLSALAALLLVGSVGCSAPGSSPTIELAATVEMEGSDGTKTVPVTV